MDVNPQPQQIKISADEKWETKKKNRHFCPFTITRQYFRLRGQYDHDQDPFFVFKGGIPVTPEQARKTLKLMLQRLNLDSDLYNMHSLRIGCSIDLYRAGCRLPQICLAGRWKSNVVYKYLQAAEGSLDFYRN